MSIYQFLQNSGVLQNGSSDQIAAMRKQYWRDYKAHWRKQKRKAMKELTTAWDKVELKILRTAAAKHRKSPTAFLKISALAYINKRYVVPNEQEVRKLSQFLAMIYTAIQEMIDTSMIPADRGRTILEKITALEQVAHDSLRTPKVREQSVEIITDKNE